MMETISDFPSPRRWRRYPKYKPSGVEWLGEVPEGWEQKRLRFLCSIKTGSKNTEDSDPFSEYPFFVRSDKVEHLSSYSFDDEAVITAGDGVGVARVFHYYKGKFDAHQRVYVLTRFKRIEGRFFYHYFKQNLADEVLKLSAKSTVDSLRLPMLQNFPVCVPPLPEQHAIAAFLDRETARIEALIEKKERQIELLQEKRSALISHAVTKGLDPNVKMKDSGIEWLGMVPEGWDIARLKFFCSINPSKSEIVSYPQDLEVSFLPMEYIGEDHSLCLDTNKPISELWNSYTYFREGDVILAKITPCFENGKCSICSGLTNEIGFGTTELHVLRSVNFIDTKFCYYLIQNHAFKTIGAELMFGTTGQKRLPEDFVKNYKQGIPPLPEQQAITAFLDNETACIDGIIEKINDSIEKINEYRSALISAAVTGKIDVRQEIPA